MLVGENCHEVRYSNAPEAVQRGSSALMHLLFKPECSRLDHSIYLSSGRNQGRI